MLLRICFKPTVAHEICLQLQSTEYRPVLPYKKKQYFTTCTVRSGVYIIIHTKTAKLCVALKSLGEKSCEIKGGSQEMAAMMLMLIKF